MRLVTVACSLFLAFGTALAAFMPATPVSADPTTTTEHITTRDGYSGTRTTTADGNTTTVVDNVTRISKDDGARVDRTTTTTTSGNPAKKKTVREVETRNRPDGTKYSTSTRNTTVTYDEAGGYTYSYNSTSTYFEKDGAVKVKDSSEVDEKIDAAGKVISGTVTEVSTDSKGTDTSHSTIEPGTQTGPLKYPAPIVTPAPTKTPESSKTSVLPGLGISLSQDQGTPTPTPTPTPQPEAPKHHASVWGWILGAGAMVAILVANGNHGNAAGNNTGNQTVNGSQIVFTPNSESICLNKFANATVKDQSNPSAQFTVQSQNTSVVQLGSAMTSGPIDITPFGLGSTNITATEVGTSKTGTLPVTVTPNC